MAKVTIKDVAKLAKVDLSTVSRVLNNSSNTHKYAPATIDRVRKAAHSLGYQPSIAARSLRTGKTMLLGLVVADIGNPFFSSIASHLDENIREEGYRLIISSTNENPVRQAEHIESMLAHGVDGLIISPCGADGLNTARKAGVPLITIDRPLHEENFPFVGLDNIAAGRMLLEKLILGGYKKIGVVIPENKNDLTLQNRLTGLKSELPKDGISLEWTVTVPQTSAMPEEVRKAVVNKLTKTSGFPDAIVGMTNVCTIGTIKALEDMHISWGESLGLSGIDDFTAAPIVNPAVSVVSQPLKYIAAEAFALLLQYITNKKDTSDTETIQIKPVWIERESLSFMK